MQKVFSRRVIKVILYAVILIISYLLQAMAFVRTGLFGIRPLVLPTAVVSVAVFEGSEKGSLFGLFAGMLCDLSMAQPMIEFTLILTLVGAGVGLLADKLLSRGFPTYVICSVAALAAASAVQTIGAILFSNASGADAFYVAWRQTLCSLIFVWPLYYPARAIAKSQALSK